MEKVTQWIKNHKEEIAAITIGAAGAAALLAIGYAIGERDNHIEWQSKLIDILNEELKRKA